MKTGDFDYFLPPEYIAQTPAEPRDSSRLLVLNRKDENIGHYFFKDLPRFLNKGDVLVMNNSRVIPARLFGRKTGSGAAVEILLLRKASGGESWEALVKPGRKLPVGSVVILDANTASIPVSARITNILEDGIREVVFSDESRLPCLGNIPLPPYIHTSLADSERYQTVYGKERGSAAAPTAGLHFTPQLLAEIKEKGIECLETTLHIGLDTFRPVQVENPAEHHIHREYGIISSETAGKLSLAKREHRRIICVGTTSVRVLEYVACKSGEQLLGPFSGWVDLLILPGYSFKLTDAMITNFHLPRSTLLMLVSAFTGRELVMKAYAEAIEEHYRFYSFGDAMLIL